MNSAVTQHVAVVGIDMAFYIFATKTRRHQGSQRFFICHPADKKLHDIVDQYQSAKSFIKISFFVFLSAFVTLCGRIVTDK